MGFPSPAADYIDDRIDLNALLITHPSATFHMLIDTDAMEGDHIVPRSMALVDRSLTPRNNDIIVAVLNGEILMRRLERKPEGVYLTASNKKYKSQKIQDDMAFQVWGVVSAVISNPNSLPHVCLGRL